MRLTTRNRTSAVLLAAGLVLGLGACSDDSDDDAASDDASTATTEGGGSAEPDTGATSETTAAEGDAAGSGALTITSFDFDDITAAGGDPVQVVDQTGAPHTVTSDDDAWEEAEVSGNGTAEFTAPSEPGDYPFYCAIHPAMTGTLTVP